MIIQSIGWGNKLSSKQKEKELTSCILWILVRTYAQYCKTTLQWWHFDCCRLLNNSHLQTKSSANRSLKPNGGWYYTCLERVVISAETVTILHGCELLLAPLFSVSTVVQLLLSGTTLIGTGGHGLSTRHAGIMFEVLWWCSGMPIKQELG